MEDRVSSRNDLPKTLPVPIWKPALVLASGRQFQYFGDVAFRPGSMSPTSWVSHLRL
jgi:hypothetical protein